MTITIGEAIREASQALSRSQTPQLDAELLLSKVLDKPRSFIFAYHDQLLTGEQLTAFSALLHQRMQQIPIAYLLGQKSFWNFELKITKDVLVPRPETELLVETILNDYADTPHLRLVDIGTGSGAIAIALALEKPDWEITAVDISPQALRVAQDNADTLLHPKAITFIESHWLNAFAPSIHFDVIVSNPPYLAVDDPHLTDTEISHEPSHALVADNNGLAAYEAMAAQAKTHLNPEGRIYVEHGNTQAQSISEIFECHGYARIKCLKDFSSHERISVFTKR